MRGKEESKKDDSQKKGKMEEKEGEVVKEEMM